jgi:hypothetical protein
MWWPDAEAKAAIAGKISPALESNLPPGISVHGAYESTICSRDWPGRHAAKSRLLSDLIKVHLSTKNRYLPRGWVIRECGRWVTAFYAKAV